jgi:hypothetical protein
MFKLPDLPSAKAEFNELADFAELLAWDKGSVSAREIVAYMGQLEDNADNVGCNDNDDENASELDEVMLEIERRMSACGNGYPFTLGHKGNVLNYLPDHQNHRSHVYLYLLLCTRLNMNTSRVHANIDGTLMLEEISAHVLKCYFGSARAQSLIFGTCQEGAFIDKVNDLCKKLGEGGFFRNIDGSAPVNANDDKLDTVTWMPFSDKSRSQLVIYGQCKTGSNWTGLVTQLRPTEFIKRWMSEPYLLDPMRALCVAEAANRAQWGGIALYAGLFLDRCRLVDFCDGLEADLLGRVQTWTTTAKASVTF